MIDITWMFCRSAGMCTTMIVSDRWPLMPATDCRFVPRVSEPRNNTFCAPAACPSSGRGRVAWFVGSAPGIFSTWESKAWLRFQALTPATPTTPSTSTATTADAIRQIPYRRERGATAGIGGSPRTGREKCDLKIARPVTRRNGSGTGRAIVGRYTDPEVTRRRGSHTDPLLSRVRAVGGQSVRGFIRWVLVPVMLLWTCLLY